MVILRIFQYFLVHNFHKNQYFQNPISLSIYIFQGSSFEVSNIKIYVFQIFFIQGSPFGFWKLLLKIWNQPWVSGKNKNRSEISGQTLSFASCDNVLRCHSNIFSSNKVFCRTKRTWFCHRYIADWI